MTAKKISSTEENNNQVPEDKCFVIYIVFFLLGIVNYLPWNFFSIATDYWMYKFRNTSLEETNSELRTPLQAEYNASFSIILQATDLISMMLSMLFGGLLRAKTRMIGGMIVSFLLLLLLTAFTVVDTDTWQRGFFGITMTVVALINSANGLFTITIFTILSKFPQHYLAPYLSGGGLSQIFSSALLLISLSFGISPSESGLIYFSLGSFVVGLTLFSYVIAASQSQFYKHYMRDFHEGEREKMITFGQGKTVLKKIWPPLATMGAVILGYNASPFALVVSEGEGNGLWNDKYFIPTVTYLTAAICEWLGRAISFKYTFNMNSVGLTIFAILRMIVFVPLFFFCNAQPRSHTSVWLPHDYQYIIITITFNLSDGYLRSLCSYNISKLVTIEELKDAHHLNMVVGAVERAILSFAGIVAVKLL